jgi:hypothetical protein
MGGPAMIRYAAAIPTAVLVGVPLWTAPTLPVILIAAVAGLFCAVGLLSLPLVTVGGSLALIDYALAAWLSGQGVDVIGAAGFGLALVFLLDLTEFARRFRGAEIAAAVQRTQIAFWLGRAAGAVAAVALLTLVGAAFAYTIPVLGRPVVSGLGAALAFAAAMRAGIVRRGRSPARIN